MIISTTERLLLREAKFEDADFILQLLNEPAWREFISSHDVETTEKAKEYIAERLHASYMAHGFGLWIVEMLEKENQKTIGLCGLLKRAELNDIDLGFAFLSAYWGRGFAREAAKASLEYAAVNLRLKKVIAITDPLNRASLTLLERLGFSYYDNFTFPNTTNKLSLFSVYLPLIKDVSE
jgi:RimJ/RimL family protein N-acetyltransferase